MKRQLKKILLVSLALVALLCLGGYLFLRGGRHYSTDLNNLRAQFNQDKGKVRLLLVLSPT
jgi:hypothetical protein